MSTALLLGSTVSEQDQDASNGLSGSGCGRKFSRCAFWPHEGRRLLSLTWPLSGSMLLSFSTTMIQGAFVGKLGSAEQSAWFLSRTFYCLTGLSIQFGLAGALETFCGQAYGARQYHKCGLFLQRALLICLTAAIPSILLWTHGYKVLLAIGMEPHIAMVASRFTLQYSPSLVLAGMEECIRRFLVAQGVVGAQLAANLIGVLATPLSCWLFMTHWTWGLTGCALATLCYHICMVLVLIITVMAVEWSREPHQRSWPGWQRECLTNWDVYFAVAVPSTLCMCLDWGSNEISSLMAGYLPNASEVLAVNGVAWDTFVWWLMIPLGVSYATSTRVSHSLGAADAQQAKVATQVAVCGVVVLTSACSAAMLLLRNSWTRVFSHDTLVLQQMSVLMFLVVATLLGAAINGTLCGALRGAGRQKLAVYGTLVSNYVVGMPLQVYLAFHQGMGVTGLWIAQVFASGLLAIVFAVYVSAFDWDAEAKRAQQLMAEVAQLSPRSSSKSWDGKFDDVPPEVDDVLTLMP